MARRSAYAKAGVDPRKISVFKKLMQEVSAKTIKFSRRRGVVVESCAHSADFHYVGNRPVYRWSVTKEGLGNKNWPAEWMHQKNPTKNYYQGIGIDTMLMAVNDLIARGAMPFMYVDEVAAGDSQWFTSPCAKDLAKSFLEACQLIGVALPQGESPSLRYLVNARLPVKSAPVISGCAAGAVFHDWNPRGVKVGDSILAVSSSGLHSNGVSLVIAEAMKLRNKFFTRLPSGNNLGEEALIPTRSYVKLVEALLDAGIPVRKFLPGTGGGLAKIAVDKRPFTYRIHDWWPADRIPPIFQFMHQHCGVSLKDCLTTFNWKAGYYMFVPKNHVCSTLLAAHNASYEARLVGRVEEGPRKVIFEAPGYKRQILPPLGD